ncbi:MAG: hypothetical protein C5B57_07260 [Blastocatellia bacterium]|nr:MAG: hypothetical protein C5B57_07260 [Blastocatellia bacterium]
MLTLDRGTMSRRRLLPRAPTIDQPEVDQLFAGLDRRHVDGPNCSWVAVVLGIHAGEYDIWIQVAPEDNPANSIVLRLSRWATVDHALAALQSCTITDETGPRVIPVMQIV